MPAKRPTKRKIEPTSDKVMREAAPRKAVTRISREDEAPPASALDAGLEDLDDADASGSSSAADLADDAASAGTRARRKAQEEQAAATAKKPRRRNKRVTEKGGGPGSSTRYTPKTVHYEDMPSPMWVPVLMFALFILGMLSIILNYMGLLPGGTNNWYLLLGLGFILAGIITATQYR